MQTEASRKQLKIPLPYRYRRYMIYCCVAIIALALPFIQINGHQIFLLSFVHKELHLLGVVFSVQELYLMPFLLILLFVGIFFMTSLGGRIWCGWGCPQTMFRVIYRDGIETKLLGLRKRINDKQKKPDFSQTSNKLKKIIAMALFSLIALTAAANFLFFFVPPYEFFEYISNPADHKIVMGFWLGIATFLLFDATLLGENFCIYMCPYARVQSVLYDNDTIMAIYDPKRGGAVYAPDGSKNALAPKKQNAANECTNCVACVKVCPTHIDIRKGMQLECINCLECVDACTSVMAHYSRPSLVQWSSPNAVETSSKVRYFRLKTIAYIAFLSLIFVILLIVGSGKETMLLNIDRNTQAYEIRKSGAVDNYYTFLLQNTDSKEHQFYFEILDADELKVLEPTEPINIKAGSKVKKAVYIRVLSPLDTALEDKDLHKKIKIRAYAIDDENIFVERETYFVYPSKQEIKSANH
ncbi:cytochrome c oxidase accessory protein CcoG [Helicobacter sp. CLO-3]|uniref:cytochrome c oxidase accessory protein CcoG n=1 Tax=unclassified Helicobacter TaxID=2593540 RepID=UPI000805FFE5|nr:MULTISPECIES: cytochrome c oxidase accessory protein CcoG [unclassified Helicobacter]OBV29187.1 cytochrome c oxidase accessory protein CcoG [Helicobacter sp. CLO-3]OHU84018.1 cytochrome c oxidase accessory protein CcoG [Helicobacter sp. CLO-3]